MVYLSIVFLGLLGSQKDLKIVNGFDRIFHKGAKTYIITQDKKGNFYLARQTYNQEKMKTVYYGMKFDKDLNIVIPKKEILTPGIYVSPRGLIWGMHLSTRAWFDRTYIVIYDDNLNVKERIRDFPAGLCSDFSLEGLCIGVSPILYDKDGNIWALKRKKIFECSSDFKDGRYIPITDFKPYVYMDVSYKGIKRPGDIMISSDKVHLISDGRIKAEKMRDGYITSTLHPVAGIFVDGDKAIGVVHSMWRNLISYCVVDKNGKKLIPQRVIDIRDYAFFRYDSVYIPAGFYRFSSGNFIYIFSRKTSYTGVERVAYVLKFSKDGKLLRPEDGTKVMEAEDIKDMPDNVKMKVVSWIAGAAGPFRHIFYGFDEDGRLWVRSYESPGRWRYGNK